MKLLAITLTLTSMTAFGGEFGITNNVETKDVPNVDNFYNVRTESEFYTGPTNSLMKASTDFPSNRVRAYDPVNKRRYQKAIAGKTYKASIFRGYDYWRYVTVYNVSTESERVSYLPYFEESCHDSSFFMAQWGETRTFKVSLTSSVGAKVGVEGLGLESSISMSIENGVAFSAQRRVQAVRGIEARHYPYKMSDTWRGVTYIQTYDKDSGTYGYLQPSYYDEWFGEYPMRFELDNQNVGFKVKRVVSKTCAGYDAEADPVSADELYMKGEFTRSE